MEQLNRVLTCALFVLLVLSVLMWLRDGKLARRRGIDTNLFLLWKEPLPESRFRRRALLVGMVLVIILLLISPDGRELLGRE